jgi:hypothetical protein
VSRTCRLFNSYAPAPAQRLPIGCPAPTGTVASLTVRYVREETVTSRGKTWMVAMGAGCVVAVAAAQAISSGPVFASTVPPGSVTVANVLSPFNSNNKTIKANCPAGKRVLGGGGFVSGTQHAVLTELQPISTGAGDGYQVSAAEDQAGERGNWAILAYAFCASAPAGLEIVSATSTPASSNAFTGISATCPGTKRLVGSGGKIDGGNGEVDLLTFPEGSLGANRTTAAGQEDPNGFGGNWTVTAYAVCVQATSLLDIQVVKTFSAGDGSTFKAATATCPSGKSATGGAGWADTPAHVEYIKPNTGVNPTSVEVGATAATGFTSQVVAIALCAS